MADDDWDTSGNDVNYETVDAKRRESHEKLGLLTPDGSERRPSGTSGFGEPEDTSEVDVDTMTSVNGTSTATKDEDEESGRADEEGPEGQSGDDNDAGSDNSGFGDDPASSPTTTYSPTPAPWATSTASAPPPTSENPGDVDPLERRGSKGTFGDRLREQQQGLQVSTISEAGEEVEGQPSSSSAPSSSSPRSGSSASSSSLEVLQTYLRDYFSIGSNSFDKLPAGVQRSVSSILAAKDSPSAGSPKTKQAPMPSFIKKDSPKAMSAPSTSSPPSGSSAPTNLEAAGTMTLDEVCEKKESEKLDGMDPKHLELYLRDEEFQKAFGMSKSEFEAMPKWKRDQKKKDAGIF